MLNNQKVDLRIKSARVPTEVPPIEVSRLNDLVAENQKQMQNIAAELEKRNQMKHEPLIDLTQASERVRHIPNQPAGSGNIAGK